MQAISLVLFFLILVITAIQMICQKKLVFMMINEDQDVERRLYNEKRKWQVYLLLVLCAAVTVCPFIWMILTSFKSYEESIQIPPTILPKIFTVESYQEIVAKFPFLSFYINTFLVLILQL